MRKLLTALIAATVSTVALGEVKEVGDWLYDAGLDREKANIVYSAQERTKRAMVACKHGKHGTKTFELSIKISSPLQTNGESFYLSFQVPPNEPIQLTGTLKNAVEISVDGLGLDEVIKQMASGAKIAIVDLDPEVERLHIFSLNGFARASNDARQQCNKS